MSITPIAFTRRRALVASFAGAASFTPLTTRAAPGDAELVARPNQTIDRAVAERTIVGTVVRMLRCGTVVYQRAAADTDREIGRAMHADALFHLASLSKMIVSAAALALIEQGRMAATDPVTRWLPDFKPSTRDGHTPAVTIHHLLTHTAGLSYGFYEPEDGLYHRAGVSDGLDLSSLSLDEEMRRIAAAGLAEAPGTGWRYSIATDVLGAAIARASDESLPDAVRRLNLRPHWRRPHAAAGLGAAGRGAADVSACGRAGAAVRGVGAVRAVSGRHRARALSGLRSRSEHRGVVVFSDAGAGENVGVSKIALAQPDAPRETTSGPEPT